MIKCGTQVLSKNKGRESKARTFDAGSSDDDFRPEGDEWSIDSAKIIKSDGVLIQKYWSDNQRANAHLYNQLVHTIYGQDGRLSPILKESSGEEAEEEDMKEFIVSDNDEESDNEIESEGSSSSARRSKSRGKSRGKKHGDRGQKAKREKRIKALDSESGSASEEGDADPVAYLKRQVRKKIGRKWRSGTVMGYRRKTQLFQISYEDEEEDDVDLQELKGMLVARKTRRADSDVQEEEEEEDSADERERNKEKARRERERQRKKARKGPPRINVLEDLRKDGFGVAVDQGSEVNFWAKCDRCQKWRHLPESMQDEVDAAELWFCTMAPGITCDDPEDPAAENEHMVDDPKAECSGTRTEAEGSASAASQSSRSRRKIVDSDDDTDHDRGRTAPAYGNPSGASANKKDEDSDTDGMRGKEGSAGGSGTRKKIVGDSDDDEPVQIRTPDCGGKASKVGADGKGKGKQVEESNSEEEIVSLKRRRFSQPSKQSNLQDNSDIDALVPEMERRRVKVWWDRKKEWFAGVVAKHDAEKNKILVLYDDDDKRWHSEAEAQRGWIQWEGMAKAELSPRQNADRGGTAVRTPRSSEYSFRDRNKKKQGGSDNCHF